MTTEAAEKPKSRRGGARKGAGRKPKGYAKPGSLTDLDVRAIEAQPAPERIEDVAHVEARAALEALKRQLLGGSSESVKVRAADEILDRGYGKAGVDAPGQPELPFFGVAPAQQLRGAMHEAARRLANLAIEVLRRIRDFGESESARVAAAKVLLKRAVGTAATATRLPDSPLAQARPVGKKEQAAESAREAATGRYATPAPPRLQ